MGPTRINTILQSAFFKLADIIPADKANELMKAAAKATYGRKGEDVVMKNWAAIDAGAQQVVEVQVPESWKNCEDEGLDMVHITEGREDVKKFVNTIQAKVNAQEGNTLPVSAFVDYVDGTTPSGSSAYEKRGIAVDAVSYTHLAPAARAAGEEETTGRRMVRTLRRFSCTALPPSFF